MKSYELLEQEIDIMLLEIDDIHLNDINIEFCEDNSLDLPL